MWIDFSMHDIYNSEGQQKKRCQIDLAAFSLLSLLSSLFSLPSSLFPLHYLIV